MDATAILATIFAAAQPAPALPLPPEPDATDITVLAPELPPPPTLGAYGAQIIPTETLAAVPNNRLETALALIPGAQQFRRSDSRSANPSAQGLTLRALGGNAASRTLLLRDGVPQGDPFFGAIAFNTLPLDSIAAIRVTRGAGAGPFGSGALAGVVELTSRDPLAGPRTAAQASLGSFDTAGGALALTRPLGAGAVALNLSGERSDGFWTTPAGQRAAASVPAAYRHLAGDLAFAIPAGDGRLDARLSAFDDRRTLRFVGADSRTSGADASLRWVGGQAGGAWPMEVLGWVQARNFTNIVISAASFRPTLNQRATPSLGWGGKWEIRPSVGDNALLRLGIDWRGASGRTDEVGLAANGTVTVRRRAGGASSVVGLFVEHDLNAGPLTLGGGIRVDRWALTGGALREARGDGTVLTDITYPARSDTLWTARGAAAYALAPGLGVRAAAYRGWRLPTLNELYRPFVLFPITTRANAALAPERLTGVEAGLTWAIGDGATADGATGDGATVALTAFANRLEGAIANVTIGPNLRQRTNLPAIAVRGVELSGHARWRGLRVDVAGAFADAQVDGGALSGRRPAQTPRWSGYTQIQWLSGFGTLAVALRHAASQFEDDSNSSSIKAFTTLDANLTMPLIRRWSLSLAAENITDSAIITRNSGGTIDLGTPRAFRLTLRYQ